MRNNQLAITLNDQDMQQDTQHKVIGVVVDENLQWREHVNGVFKTVSQTMALFRRIKHFLPKWSKIMFYNAYIMPHFDYCVTVWGDCSDLNKLAKLQKQAARIILDCHYLTPSKDMFCTLKWLPMKDWVKYMKATMTFKAINGNAPDYISSMFKPSVVVANKPESIRLDILHTLWPHKAMQIDVERPLCNRAQTV